jgi:branched-chain amino acid transport system substrate-binding protein
MEVANAPGTKIYPGELGKGLKILAKGGDIDYVGGSSVELIGGGESAGNYADIWSRTVPLLSPVTVKIQ